MPSKGPEQDNYQATSWRAKMVARQVALQPAPPSSFWKLTFTGRRKVNISSADNLRFNACTNMDMIDDILVRRMYDFDVKYASRS